MTKWSRQRCKRNKANFESLKMKEEESIVDYLFKIDEIVSVIKGLGEKVKDSIVVQNV